MEFNLAKQLKDAGFSQYPAHNNLSNKKELDASMDRCIVKSGGVIQPHEPTLSELIVACGLTDRQFYLQRIDSEWIAQVDDADECVMDCCGSKGEGKTPEEAVALLWLDIQNNKHEKDS